MKFLLTIHVDGTPRPAGSKRAFPIKKGGAYTGRVAVVDSNPASKDWKCDVAHAAKEAMTGLQPIVGKPIMVAMSFWMQRPKAHFRANGDLKHGVPEYHSSKPDALKLARAVEDALTGIVWGDDSQIAREVLVKSYVSACPGVTIVVEEL